MRNAGAPLLNKQHKKARWSFCIVLPVLFLCSFIVLHFLNSLGANETQVAELAGCQTITGLYMETSSRDDMPKEVFVFQHGCRGRDVAHGATFTVFGDTVTLGEAKGDVQPDKTITWSNGDRWTPITTPSPYVKGATPAKPKNGTEPEEECDKSFGGNCKCENIAGTYKEYNPDKPDEGGETVIYRQLGCTGADLSNNDMFTIKKRHVKIAFGKGVEGDVQKDGSIVWSNGFIHKPLSKDIGGGVMDTVGQLTGFSGISSVAQLASGLKGASPKK